MSWLLWREYRLNRWILATGVVGVIMPYLIFFASGSNNGAFSAHERLIGAFGWSSIFAYLTIALLAGSASAAQRADRSAEFVGYLPLTRLRLLASKLILALVLFVWICCVNLTAVGLFVQPAEPFKLAGMVNPTLLFSGVLATYCVGWLATQFMSSSVFSSLIAFCGPFVSAGIAAGIVGLSPFDLATLHQWCILINVPVAIVCFSIGTWHYLRRIEP